MGSREWKEVKLGEVGKIVTGKTPKTKITQNYGNEMMFLTPSDDMNVKRVYSTKRMLSELGVSEVRNCILPRNSVCVSCIGSDLGKVVLTTEPCVTNQQINSIIPYKDYYYDYLYYALTLLGEHLNFISKTSTAVPIINKTSFSNYSIKCPYLPEQKAIATTLSCLDDMIELNDRTNQVLEEMAQAIFKHWFVDFEFPNEDGQPYKSSGGAMIDSELGEIPEGWRVASLLDIADYLNGLAMQKFRPAENEKGYPVLKIKELRQGVTDSSSDLCSKNIDPKYIVNDGDLIFSWSGSLMVDFWCGGKCGLNQHLFKVTSTQYHKWYYYLWTKYHLQKFIEIARDKATTMGHIKRGHLKKAKVLIMDDINHDRLDSICGPIIEIVIANRIANRKLITLRDTLLPRLMSGEIRVPLDEEVV